MNHKRSYFISSRIFAAILFSIVSLIIADPSPLDTLYLAGKYALAGVKSEGLSKAGIAIPDGVLGTLKNPSLLHTHIRNKGTKILASACYGREEAVFSRHVLSAGAGYSFNEMATVGMLYRYLKADSRRIQNEILMNISGQLFEKNEEQGGADIGINVRYQRMRWETGGFSTLYTRHISDSGETTIDSSSWETGDTEHHRLLFDLGFFQENVSDALDFGLTFTNILGYIWKSDKPHTVHIQDTSSIPDTTIDSLYYINETEKSKGWIHRYYKGIALGIVYHTSLMEDKAFVQIPLDFDLIGLFDRSPHLSFRTGIDLTIMGSYSMRFGYARAPDNVIKASRELSNDNIISGGAGFSLDHFSFDLYIRKKAWGVGGSVLF